MSSVAEVFTPIAVGLFLSSLLWTCNADEEVDQVLDCASICRRYRECIDGDYDVNGCTSSCEDNAETEQGFDQKADACAACIDDRACTESFPCTDECLGIIP